MENKLTQGIKWLETRLDEGAWFRRIYVLTATWLTWASVRWAMYFAETSKLSGVEVAAVIAAVEAPIAVVQAFAFNHYLGARLNDKRE